MMFVELCSYIPEHLVSCFCLILYSVKIFKSFIKNLCELQTTHSILLSNVSEPQPQCIFGL